MSCKKCSRNFVKYRIDKANATLITKKCKKNGEIHFITPNFKYGICPKFHLTKVATVYPEPKCKFCQLKICPPSLTSQISISEVKGHSTTSEEEYSPTPFPSPPCSPKAPNVSPSASSSTESTVIVLTDGEETPPIIPPHKFSVSSNDPFDSPPPIELTPPPPDLHLYLPMPHRVSQPLPPKMPRKDDILPRRVSV